jgi:hypothetical protein
MHKENFYYEIIWINISLCKARAKLLLLLLVKETNKNELKDQFDEIIAIKRKKK